MNSEVIVVILGAIALSSGNKVPAITLGSLPNSEIDSALVRSSNSSNRTDATPFIVGGVEASRNEFPWMVNLRIGRSFCGGALIEMDLVLTAAHCVHEVSKNRITIIAGDHRTDTYEITEQNSSALAVKWHESYNKKSFVNDIALVRLSKNLTETAAVKKIALPPPNYVINETGNGTVMGWGHLSYSGGSLSPVLRKVVVPIANFTFCNTAYREMGGITNNQFCAGTGGKDSCQGDSGGPFICHPIDRTICGIVSYGNECALARYPGVYTKVSSHISWIKSNRFINSSSKLPSSLMLLLISLSFLSI